MEELALKIEHVSKQYRLGAIGGGTLKGDLQTWWARKHGREDPNSKIGSKQVTKVGERFLALDDIDLEVKKGEALGIIGHNGAGKSTLLKLLSRVTAPTEGKISINGRIASMLEVGTGFHPELTGRENIYMRGAILGMTRAEIARKFDQIVEFSEVAQFIDTPVKRYSSGMYVKLGFSVSAHLDSEIMIMDEVLAVGDMAFQKKCIEKMREAADKEGRTVLYVSHNMNTIRQLCDRCIVLDHGKIIFDGDVQEAIALYLGHDSHTYSNYIKVNANMRDQMWSNPPVSIEEIYSYSDDGILSYGSTQQFRILIKNHQRIGRSVYLRIMVKTASGIAITMASTSEKIHVPEDAIKSIIFHLNTACLVPGAYSLSFVLYEVGEYGADQNIDVLRDVYSFTILASPEFNHGMKWNAQWWGHITIGDIKIITQ